MGKWKCLVLYCAEPDSREQCQRRNTHLKVAEKLLCEIQLTQIQKYTALYEEKNLSNVKRHFLQILFKTIGQRKLLGNVEYHLQEVKINILYCVSCYIFNLFEISYQNVIILKR